jgi:SAM-dependent methyltransferase
MTSPNTPPQGRHAPATERNRAPILDVLRRILPPRGTVLEVASGTGQHAVAFASALPGLTWQPTDADADALDSIRAWAAEAALANLAPPLPLDATRAQPWPVERADAVVCINMIHIAPWEACTGLMRGTGQVLSPGGALVLYGPYRLEGRHTAPSNAAFEDWLKAQDPRFGVRDLEAVTEEAARHGLTLLETVPMPANNFTVVFRKV